MLDEQTKHNVRIHLNAAIASLELARHYATGDDELVDRINLNTSDILMNRVIHASQSDSSDKS